MWTISGQQTYARNEFLSNEGRMAGNMRVYDMRRNVRACGYKKPTACGLADTCTPDAVLMHKNSIKYLVDLERNQRMQPQRIVVLPAGLVAESVHPLPDYWQFLAI